MPDLDHPRHQQHSVLCLILYHPVTEVTFTSLQTEYEDVPNCCKEYVQSPYPEEVAYSYPYCLEGEKLLHSIPMLNADIRDFI